MNEQDIDYFIRRAAQERGRAHRSDDSAARTVHDRLAEAYEARLRAAGIQPLGWDYAAMAE